MELSTELLSDLLLSNTTRRSALCNNMHRKLAEHAYMEKQYTHMWERLQEEMRNRRAVEEQLELREKAYGELLKIVQQHNLVPVGVLLF